MRLLAILLFGVALGVHAKPAAQTVSLSVEKASLKQVFSTIRDQTGYLFVANREVLSSSTPVSLKVTDIPLVTLLDMVMKTQPLTYRIEGKQIIIARKSSGVVMAELPAQNLQATVLLPPVAGRIVGDDGLPLSGVSILIKGSKKGTASGADGSFKMEVNEGEILVISSVGYSSLSLRLKGDSFSVVSSEEGLSKVIAAKANALIIRLAASSSYLEESLVIGYGEQRREKVTGAIASISSKELNDMPASSFQDLLQGKMPGVLVNTWSGEPGVRSETYIRGMGVVGNNRNISPLYVIDGIPIEPVEDRTMLSRSTNTDPLAGINPNDIESIDILKDASAAAIYGSRGANGVIIIKTKRGMVSKPQVSYNGNASLSIIPALQETVGGKRERELKIKLWQNRYSFPELDMMLTDSLNPFYNNSTDWQKLYYTNAFTTDHSASIAGGTEGITYRLSLGARSENGIMVGSDFKRYSINNTTRLTPHKNVSIDFRLILTRTDRSRPNGDNNSLTTNSGIGSNYPSSLIPGAMSAQMKALVDAYEMMSSVNVDDNIRPSIGINVTLKKNFRFNSRFSIDINQSERSTFKPSALNGVNTQTGRLNGPSFNNSINTGQTLLSENTLSYIKNFNSGHTFDAVVGFSETFNERKNSYINATRGVSDAVKDLNGYASANTTTSSRYAANGLRSFFSRVQYDYDSKYVLSLSARADASSRFGKNYRWGYFPSAAIAWNIHREDFLKQIGWIDMLKARWSWGVNGNQFGNDFLAQGVYSTSGLGSFTGTTVNTYNGQPIVTPSYTDGLANPDLTWEQSEQFNFGIDYSMLDYRVSVNFDAYWKNTTGILFNFQLPDISGYKSVYKNATEVINYGYELGLKVAVLPHRSVFKWETNLNVSLNRNVVSKLPNNNADILQRGSVGDQLIRVGRPANGYFVYMVDGIYSTPKDVAVNPHTGAPVTWSGIFKAGDYRVQDLDGSGRIYEVNAQTGALMTSDRTFYGNNFPIVSGGFHNTFRYKQWSMNLNFNYSIGRDVMNATLATKIRQILMSPTGNMYDYTKYDHWQQPGDNAAYPNLSPDRYKEMPALYNVTNLSIYMEDASYIKLNNVRLGYNIDPTFLKKYKIRNCAFFVQGMNLLKITKYTGSDPENISAFGVDEGRNYARPKVFNFGFNCEF